MGAINEVRLTNGMYYNYSGSAPATIKCCGLTDSPRAGAAKYFVMGPAFQGCKAVVSSARKFFG